MYKNTKKRTKKKYDLLFRYNKLEFLRIVLNFFQLLQFVLKFYVYTVNIKT